jgi:hypothetical protein
MTARRKLPGNRPLELDLVELRKKLVLLKRGKLITPPRKPKKHRPGKRLDPPFVSEK